MKKTLLLALLLSALLVLFGCSAAPESGKTDNPVTHEQPVPSPDDPVTPTDPVTPVDPVTPSEPAVPEGSKAYTKGLSSLFNKPGVSVSNITLEITLLDGLRFDSWLFSGMTAMSLFKSGLPDDLTAYIKELRNDPGSGQSITDESAGSVSSEPETYTTVVIGFLGDIVAKPSEELSLSIYSSWIYNYDGPPIEVAVGSSDVWYEEHNVTFVLNNGEADVVKKVGTGETVLAPPVQKEGYNFVNWYLGDKVFDFTTKIREDLTIEAKWDLIGDDVTVTWVYDSITDKKTTTKSPKGQKITSIADGQSGAESVADTFKHWSAESTGAAFDFGTVVNDHITLYAVYNELNIGDIYTVNEYKGNYTEIASDIKNKGIRLYIIAKRGVRGSLPATSPYKYIGVDMDHDLSYYINTSRGNDYYNQLIENHISYKDKLWVKWGLTADATAGTDFSIGGGYANTQKALALKGVLYKTDYEDGDETIWNRLLEFREDITEENRQNWFIPSHSEMVDIAYLARDEKINNLTQKGGPDYYCNYYFTSSEVGAERSPSDYRAVAFADGEQYEPGREIYGDKTAKSASRIRLCRIL